MTPIGRRSSETRQRAAVAVARDYAHKRRRRSFGRTNEQPGGETRRGERADCRESGCVKALFYQRRFIFQLAFALFMAVAAIANCGAHHLGAIRLVSRSKAVEARFCLYLAI